MFLSRLTHFIKVQFSSDRALYNDLNKLLGEYPINLSLYKRAFTHRSALRLSNYQNKEHNERLEFLGDAILGSIVADYLYIHFPHHKEGSLTQMRAKLVNRATLNQVAQQHHLEKYLVAQVNFQFEGKNIYSNMVEALIGAVYLDKGYPYTRKFVLDKLLVGFLKEDLDAIEHDFKSRVLEWGQKRRHSIDFISETRLDTDSSNHLFSSNVLINGEVAGQGVGASKKEAEQNAARIIWEKWSKSQDCKPSQSIG